MLRLATLACRRRCIASASTTRLYNYVAPSPDRSVDVAEVFRSKNYLIDRFRLFLEEPATDAVPRQAYQLMKACASGLMYESPQARTTIAHKIWEGLQEKYKEGGMDVGLYNTLLLVYLQNEHTFSPSKFLETMQSTGVSPNQGTFMLLLQGYCQQGNIAGSTAILEHMKAEEFPINEHAYAALITGHARSGDLSSAEQMLDMMREREVEPTIVSYTSLMCAQAEAGDMEAIRRVVADMKSHHLFPNVATYLKVVDRLSKAGHSQHILEALDMIRNKQWVQSDIKDLACQVSTRGEFESALVLVQCLRHMNVIVEHSHIGSLIVRSMINTDCAVGEILDMVHRLLALGFKNEFHEILYRVIHAGNPDDMLTVLRDMHSRNVTIKSHYFYPLLAVFAKGGDMDGVLNGMKTMKEFGVMVDSYCMRYPSQAAGKGGIQLVMESVRAAGLLNELGSLLVFRLCQHGEFERVPDLLSSIDEEHLLIGFIIKAIESTICRHPEACSVNAIVRVYTILHSLECKPSLSASIRNIISYLGLNCGMQSKALEIIAQLQSNGVTVGNDAYLPLLKSYCNFYSKKDFFKILREMQSHDLPIGPQEHALLLRLSADLGDYTKATSAFNALKQHYPEMSVSFYINYIKACVKSKLPRGILQAVSLIKEMCSQGMKPSADTFSLTVDALLRLGDLETAVAVKDEMVACGYLTSFGVYHSIIEAFAKRGDVARAREEYDKVITAGVKPSWYTYTLLMSAYMAHGAVEPIRQIIKEATSAGVTLSRPMVTQLVTAYMNNGDTDGAMAASLEYPYCPPVMSATTSLVNKVVEQGEESKAVEWLKRLNVSEMNIKEILLFAHLRAGNGDHARDILKEGSLQYNVKSFRSFARDCTTCGQTDRLRDGIAVLLEADLPSNETSIAMLRAYGYKLKDLDGAAQLQKNLEARGMTLPPTFQIVLDRLNRAKSAPVL